MDIKVVGNLKSIIINQLELLILTPKRRLIIKKVRKNRHKKIKN